MNESNIPRINTIAEMINVKLLLLSAVFLCCSFFCFVPDTAAQNMIPGTDISAELPAEEMELPFIDRDSDGINDLLQNGWGLRFAERYKKRQELWEQLNVEIIKDENGKKVDTDGDGVGDISFHDFMKQKMNEPVDSDGDGKADTSLKDYLGKRFRSLDKDGDGLPDDVSAEEIRMDKEEMKEWRKEIQKRIRNGLQPFLDADKDGIPDDLPRGLQQRQGKQ